MRKISLFILIMLFASLPVFAKDEVHKGSTVLIGKITSFVDGIIQLEYEGTLHTYIRNKNDDYFGDYIRYRERPIKGGNVETNCRVVMMDDFHVTFVTRNNKITLPRYRVSEIVVDAN